MDTIILASLAAVAIIVAMLLTLTQKTELPNKTPYYFIAIHNEPNHGPNTEPRIADQYRILKGIIAKADEYDIKLTLMFSAQWADYISNSSERISELQSWADNGHEIAAHHHSIYHGTWDGYTDFPKEATEAQRMAQGKAPEPYVGTLEDYMWHLGRMYTGIKSGCMNDEHDKQVMPNGIVYDTCSGFANFGEPGKIFDDGTTPEKGRNEFISVGMVNGIERKWLTDYQITNDIFQKEAQRVFASMDDGVYGVVTHSLPGQDEPLFSFMEYLHSVDPEARGSKTMSEIIEGGLLPEVQLSDELLTGTTQEVKGYGSAPRGRCRDGICDQLEQENPDLCPDDCL